jgi:hypothetical protein
LTFTQKSKCGGGWCEPHHCSIYTKDHPWLKNDDDSSVLLYKKKKEEKKIYMKKRKKKKKKHI